jgi:hypothetical protein
VCLERSSVEVADAQLVAACRPQLEGKPRSAAARRDWGSRCVSCPSELALRDRAQRAQRSSCTCLLGPRPTSALSRVAQDRDAASRQGDRAALLLGPQHAVDGLTGRSGKPGEVFLVERDRDGSSLASAVDVREVAKTGANSQVHRGVERLVMSISTSSCSTAVATPGCAALMRAKALAGSTNVSAGSRAATVAVRRASG